MQAGEAMLYRLAVGLFLKDQTGAGLRSLDKSAGAAEKRIGLLQKELDRLNKTSGTAPKTAVEAQQRVLALQRQEAVVRAKLATAGRVQEQNLYRARLTALGMARQEAVAQQRQFAVKERQDRLAVSRQATIAKQQARAREAEQRGIEKAALTQKREDEALAARRVRIGLAAQRRADAYAARQKANADAEDRRTQRIAASEQRRLQVQQRIQQRQQAAKDKQQQRDSKHTTHKAADAVKHAGATAGWTGLAMLGGLGYAVEKAAQFDQTTLETQMALTGGKPMDLAKRRAQMAALKKAAYSGSQATGFFSAAQIMEGLKAAASSGAMFFGADEFIKSTPTIARYMDIAGRLKGEDPATAAKQYVQFSHMAQKYTAKDQVGVANTAALFALLQPHSMEQGVTALGQMLPVFGSLGKGDYTQAFAIAAAADQGGVGNGRVGARLKDYIDAFVMRQAPGREAAKARLHLRDAIDENGRLDIGKSLDAINRAQKAYIAKYGVKKGTSNFNTDLGKAIGAEALPIAAFLMSDKGRDLYRGNLKYLGQASKGDYLTPMQDTLRQSPEGQQQQIQAKLDNAILEFGTTGLPLMVKYLTIADKYLDKMDQFATTHPRLFEGILNAAGALLGFSVAVGAVSNAVTVAKGGAAIYKWTAAIANSGIEAEAAAAGVGEVTGAFKALTLLRWAALAGGVALLVGTIIAIHAKAVAEGNKRMENGTDATERQQYQGMKLYDKNGQLDLMHGEYNVFGTKLDDVSLSRWRLYNGPLGKRWSRAGSKSYGPGGVSYEGIYGSASVVPVGGQHLDKSIHLGPITIAVPPGTTQQQSSAILDELHRQLLRASNAHGDDPLHQLDPRPSVGGMAFGKS
jgi:hypothetical protein